MTLALTDQKKTKQKQIKWKKRQTAATCKPRPNNKYRQFLDIYLYMAL